MYPDSSIQKIFMEVEDMDLVANLALFKGRVPAQIRNAVINALFERDPDCIYSFFRDKLVFCGQAGGRRIQHRRSSARAFDDHPVNMVCSAQHIGHFTDLSGHDRMSNPAAAYDITAYFCVTDNAHSEPIFFPAAPQQSGIPFFPATKSVIMPNNYPFHLQSAYNDILNKVLSISMSEFTVEIDTDERLDAGIGDESCLVFRGGDKLKPPFW